MNVYPRETVEFLPVTISGGTGAVKYAVTGTGERPETWVNPIVLGDESGVMIEGLAPGYYKVWCRVESAPEVPVINCGAFQIT